MDNERLVRTYVKINDARKDLKSKFTEEDNKLKAQLETVQVELLRVLNESNSNSIRTDAGTFYAQEDITPTGSDWDLFYHWVAKNDTFDFLERRIKKASVKEYMESHEGAPPPGVSVYRERVVRVRRS